jgi:hypothetical protein
MFLHSSSGCKVGRLSDCEIPEFDASHRRGDGLEKRYNSANKFKCHTLHCKENPIYVFLFWELRGLSPNFHIHVSVSDLYIPRIGPHISPQHDRQTDPGNIYKSLTDI